MKNFLPIGSVVLLKEGKKRIMIYGRLQRNNDNGKLFDYIGCFYPEGSIDTTKVIMFNHEDIETLFFIGFQDGEELTFRKKLSDAYEQQLK